MLYNLAIFSIGLHIFGAIFVLHSLIFDFDSWINYMNYSRYLLGLNNHNHNPNIILNIWMIAIQIRYIITDSIIFYHSLRNHTLVEYTIKIHGIESMICAIAFLLHHRQDCFIFGLVCIIWSFLWIISYFLIKNKKK
jgi:hypothetical protein